MLRQRTTVNPDQPKTAILEGMKRLMSYLKVPTGAELGEILTIDRDTNQYEGDSSWLYCSLHSREVTYGGRRSLDRTTIEME